uniref:Tail collar fiber protein n=2 Tax=unclassified Caudoviricetes TaxID=2788787 RepID=A0A8S5Q475_9CAUD|nr:MAG TPA: tail collar fiber protein [Myoviridae sp. ctTDl1]
MTAQYFTVLTDYGTQAFAKAIATNQPIQFSSFAVGDGNGQAVTPTADRTALVKEIHRANVSAVSLDPRNNKQIIIELTIPEDVGGFYIREMGVFDSTNKLVAYANSPESFKPTLESGSGKVQVLRMILKVSNSQAVTLSIDNSVIFVTRQQLNPKKITSSTTNGFDESGHSHEIEKADTTKAGIVQLTDDTGLDSDKLGLSARAGKKLAQLISTVQLALGNYIPNNKKSNSVTSTSNDNVATSSAVKTAYDKGVEAKSTADNAQLTANDGVSKANNAQRSADNANTNANGRVSKNGDTMSGPLAVPRVSTGSVESSGYVNISSNNGVVFYNKGNSEYTAILSENGLDIKKAVMSHDGLKSDHIGYGGYGSQYDYSAPFEVIEAAANSIGTFYPFIKGKVMSRGNSGAAFSLGYTTKQTGYNEYGNFGRGVINLVEDNGSFKNWEFEHTGVFRSAGDVITGNGNSLNWQTHVLNSLIGGITSSSYGSHYQGANVFKIKQNRLMIIRMQVGVVNSSGDYYLPESFDGPASAIAIDSGGAVNPVGAFFKGGNSVYISVTKPTNVSVVAIGVKN